MEDCETGVLAETRYGVKEGDQKLHSHCIDISDVEVVRVLNYSSSRKKQEEPESWKKFHVGGVDGISCQHLQVKMANLLQKHWEWQEDRTPMLRHGSVVRTTMYLANMDINTAFDEARPRHAATFMESHNTHGWLISALLREMSGLVGQAMFECVESKISFNRCLRQGSVEAPRLWQKMATQLLANVEENWLRNTGVRVVTSF